VKIRRFIKHLVVCLVFIFSLFVNTSVIFVGNDLSKPDSNYFFGTSQSKVYAASTGYNNIYLPATKTNTSGSCGSAEVNVRDISISNIKYDDTTGYFECNISGSAEIHNTAVYDYLNRPDLGYYEAKFRVTLTDINNKSYVVLAYSSFLGGGQYSDSTPYYDKYCKLKINAAPGTIYVNAGGTSATSGGYTRSTNTTLAKSNNAPVASISIPSEGQSFSGSDSIIPTIIVSDPDNDTLTCRYFIDSEPVERGSLTVYNTSTAQSAQFLPLNVGLLSV